MFYIKCALCSNLCCYVVPTALSKLFFSFGTNALRRLVWRRLQRLLGRLYQDHHKKVVGILRRKMSFKCSVHGLIAIPHHMKV